MIEGIDKELLRRYVETRDRIDQSKKTIYAISSILAVYKHVDDACPEIDAYALGHVNQLMNKAILDVWEALDDFIPIVSARLALQEADAHSCKTVNSV